MRIWRRKILLFSLLWLSWLIISTAYSIWLLPAYQNKQSQKKEKQKNLEERAANRQLDSLLNSLSERELNDFALRTRSIRNDSLLQYLPVSELRLVIISYSHDYNDEIVIPSSYLHTFVQAQIKLRGPGGPGKKAEEIKVAQPRLDGPYWWTHPSLEAKEAFQYGALFISWQESQTVWQRPKNPAIEPGDSSGKKRNGPT